MFIDNNDNKWVGTRTGFNIFNESEINTTYTIKPKEDPYFFTLLQNFPNPFNSTAIINYGVMEESKVNIKAYDILGREIQTLVNEVKQYGKYSGEFDASNLPSGIYIYQMQVGRFSQSKKAVLIK